MTAVCEADAARTEGDKTFGADGCPAEMMKDVCDDFDRAVEGMADMTD